MQNPRSQSSVERLYSLSKAASPVVLAREAEAVVTTHGASQLDRGLASVLWAYGLVRQDAHKHRDLAADLAKQGLVLLSDQRSQDPFMVDWAMLMAGVSWQLLGDHERAITLLDEILSPSDLDIAHRVKGAFSRAFSLYALGQQQDALHTHRQLADELDRLPEAQQTLSTRRDRQRVRLNMADHYLNVGDFDAAAEALAGLQEE
jgi:tetratricopeptide (TPR) repeat protein